MGEEYEKNGNENICATVEHSRAYIVSGSIGGNQRITLDRCVHQPLKGEKMVHLGKFLRRPQRSRDNPVNRTGWSLQVSIRCESKPAKITLQPEEKYATYL
jgi:hypothetical protein